jgi:superkiller protein 3
MHAQLVEVLYLLLPESSLFPTLSNLPPPDPTNPTSSTISGIQEPIHDSLPLLQQIVTLVEKDEDETIKKEIDKRRKRLNAPSPEDAKREVEMLFLGPSRVSTIFLVLESFAEALLQLPHLYNEILNHPNTPDDLRRQTESKLLRHKQRYLHALPSSSEFASVKSKVATELENLVNGAVILRIPDEMAWVLFIDGKDCETIGL